MKVSSGESEQEMVHEVRNALVPLLTALHAIRDSGHASPEMLGVMEQQVARISALLDRFEPRKSEAVTPAARAGKLRVLVVDDNRAAAKALQLGLGMLGCEVAIAHDGAAAFAVAQELLPDVAVLDLGLPDEDGIDLARRLRAQRPLALIALTGHDERERTREAGFAHHLLKPVDLLVLHRSIVSAVGGDTAPAHSK